MIVVIAGPTGTGKSSLAIELAERINGEIINSDAFQVYEGLRIATAYPSEENMKRAPHHLYGFVPLDEPYSIALYQKDCRLKIEEILSKGKTPILVGGSGLYIRAALYDYDLSQSVEEVDEKRFESLSNEELHGILEKLDAEEAKKIHPNNRRRVIRAISICEANNESKTEILNKQNHKPLYDAKFFWLSKNRDELYPLVEQRVEQMFADGLLEETLPLIERYGREPNAFQAIGVKELFPYIDGEITLDETKALIKAHTRQYIKRQETFLRHQFQTITVTSLDEVIQNLE